jgi:hypothetical protein
MAAPTEAQIMALLLAQVGDPDGTLAAQWDVIWALSVGASPLAARILVAKLALIDVALGAASQQVNFSDGDYSQSASDRAKALLRLREATLTALETAQRGGGAAIGTLTKTTPETPPTGPLVRPHGPNALDPEFTGDPYYPLRERAGRRW